MVVEVTVNGIENYFEEVKKNQGKTIFALFSGTPDSSGQNWCPDCVRADPVVTSCLSQAPEDAIFIHCGVGDRPTWKDPNNPFRTHPELSLKGVPTLIKVGSKQRLREAECANADLVTMLFTED